MSCGGVTSGASPSPYPDESTPPFAQLLLVSKVAQYQVTLKATSSVQGGGIVGEQQWYLKLGRARFDFVTFAAGRTTNVSVFLLPNGVFSCVGSAAETKCVAISDSDATRWSNPAAFYQATLSAHPAQFTGVAVGQRHIGDEHGHCYDIHQVSGSGAFPDGHFCYTLQGIPLALRVAEPTSQWSFEATSVARTVPDSVFTLPATPTVGGP
jgi:hypothetical protein